jgi:hypothetical protein
VILVLGSGLKWCVQTNIVEDGPPDVCGDGICSTRHDETIDDCPQDCCPESGLCYGIVEGGTCYAVGGATGHCSTCDCVLDCPASSPCDGLIAGSACFEAGASGVCEGCTCATRCAPWESKNRCYGQPDGAKCTYAQCNSEGECKEVIGACFDCGCSPLCPAAVGEDITELLAGFLLNGYPSSCLWAGQPCETVITNEWGSTFGGRGNCRTCVCVPCGGYTPTTNHPCATKADGDECTMAGGVTGKCDLCGCVEVCTNQGSPCYQKTDGELCSPASGPGSGYWGVCDGCDCKVCDENSPCYPYEKYCTLNGVPGICEYCGCNTEFCGGTPCYNTREGEPCIPESGPFDYGTCHDDCECHAGECPDTYPVCAGLSDGDHCWDWEAGYGGTCQDCLCVLPEGCPEGSQGCISDQECADEHGASYFCNANSCDCKICFPDTACYGKTPGDPCTEDGVDGTCGGRSGCACLPPWCAEDSDGCLSKDDCWDLTGNPNAWCTEDCYCIEPPAAPPPLDVCPPGSECIGDADCDTGEACVGCVCVLTEETPDEGEDKGEGEDKSKGECGDGVCDPDENQDLCPQDCVCVIDGVCSPGETACQCSEDCGYCGDGCVSAVLGEQCETDEDCAEGRCDNCHCVGGGGESKPEEREPECKEDSDCYDPNCGKWKCVNGVCVRGGCK